MPIRVGLKYIDIWNSSMEDEVCAYEREDVQKGKIVFYGPSYFTRWSTKYGMKPMNEVLLGKSGSECVVNRGFGSSCPEHHLYYYHRMVKPLEPKVLVYASHGNGGAFGYPDEESWELAQRVVGYTLTDFPECRIYLCSAAPKKELTAEELEMRRKYNGWVKEFAQNTLGCFYLDYFEYAPLHNPDFFIEDGIHFNRDGYNAFGEFFKAALEKELSAF